MPRYTDSFVSEVVDCAEIVGPHRASVEYGVAYHTARRWLDHAQTGNARAAALKATPSCSSCGTPLTRRTPPTSETPTTMCRSCAATARADAARGYSVEELARRYIHGQSTSELAALTGHSQAGIYDLLKRHGVQMRDPPPGHSDPKRRHPHPRQDRARGDHRPQEIRVQHHQDRR